MRIWIALVSVLLLVLGLGGLQTAAAKSAGPTSFLTEYAETPDQVVSQVEGNRLIALRYARVFVKDPSAVLSYFRGELSLTTLDRPMHVTVYCLDEARRVVTDTRELKAGTKIFANAAGYPVLEYGTGNPLTSTLPGKGQPRPATNSIAQSADSQGAAPADTQPKLGSDSAKTVLDQVIAEGGTPPVTPSDPLSPATPGGGTISPTFGTGGSAGASGGSAGISSGARWLPALGAIAAAAALAGGRGMSSDITGDPGNNGNGGGSNPPVVPEPASMMVLGTGLMTLGGVLRRAMRR